MNFLRNKEIIYSLARKGSEVDRLLTNNICCVRVFLEVGEKHYLATKNEGFVHDLQHLLGLEDRKDLEWYYWLLPTEVETGGYNVILFESTFTGWEMKKAVIDVKNVKITIKPLLDVVNTFDTLDEVLQHNKVVSITYKVFDKMHTVRTTLKIDKLMEFSGTSSLKKLNMYAKFFYEGMDICCVTLPNLDSDRGLITLNLLDIVEIKVIEK